VVWQQLLSCERSELMCCIPLAAERMSDLQRAQLEVLQQQAAAHAGLLAAMCELETFAAVNRSTADEIEGDGLVTRVSSSAARG
jgi:hypothetical protein